MPCGPWMGAAYGTRDAQGAAVDVSSIATAYSAFGGVLTGFAFSGLSFYVTRSEPGTDRTEVDVLIPRRGKPIRFRLPVSAVAAVGFYAMASLGVSTFLYASVATGTSTAQKVEQQGAIALLAYGVIFGLSVLTLFYFVTLMLFERRLTRRAARPAFWVGTFAASIVVLRFVAKSAQDAMCPEGVGCYRPDFVYTTHGIIIMLGLAAIAFAAITLTRVLERRGLRLGLRWLARSAAMPAACVFIIVVVVATLVSLYITQPGNVPKQPYVPPTWVISVIYGLGALVFAFFGLASGSVVYARVRSIGLTTSRAPAGAHASENVPWWGIWELDKEYLKNLNLARMKYSSGVNPGGWRWRGRRVWKVPAVAKSGESAGVSEVVTEFRVCHKGRSWWPYGMWFLMTGREETTAKGDCCVQVTLNFLARDGQRIEKNVSAGKTIQFTDVVPEARDVLRVAVKRLDSSEEDVLLCWIGGGLISGQEPRESAAAEGGK